MKRCAIFMFLCSFSSVNAISQDVYHFKKGLAILSRSRYGREALNMDALAYQLYNGTLKTPAEGLQVNLEENAAPVVWQPVTADSANRFIVRSRSGGYIYLTYNSDKERTALLNVIGNYKVLVNGEPHMGDVNQSGWLLIPIKLKKGLNEFYI